jgi:hypothetical protein
MSNGAMLLLSFWQLGRQHRIRKMHVINLMGGPWVIGMDVQWFS